MIAAWFKLALDENDSSDVVIKTVVITDCGDQLANIIRNNKVKRSKSKS